MILCNSGYCDQDCQHQYIVGLRHWLYIWVSRLWLYAGLIGSNNPCWLKADFVVCVNPFFLMDVSGWMFLLVPAYWGCSEQGAIKRLCVCLMCKCYLWAAHVECVGVYLCKHADVISPEPLKPRQSGMLVVFKVIKVICNLFVVVMCCSVVPSVLWHCWLGGRKGIRPVKNWAVGCWHGCLSGARCRLAYGPADATATHCLLLQ